MRVKYLLIGAAVLFAAGVLASSSYAKVSIGDCIGLWLFDDGKSAKDSSGSGNDGELIGEPKSVDGKFGEVRSILPGHRKSRRCQACQCKELDNRKGILHGFTSIEISFDKITG